MKKVNDGKAPALNNRHSVGEDKFDDTETPETIPVEDEPYGVAEQPYFSAGEVWEVLQDESYPDWLRDIVNSGSSAVSVFSGQHRGIVIKTAAGNIRLTEIPKSLTPESGLWFAVQAPALLLNVLCSHFGCERGMVDYSTYMVLLGIVVEGELVRFRERRNGVAVPYISAVVSDWHGACNSDDMSRGGSRGWRRRRDGDPRCMDALTLVRMLDDGRYTPEEVIAHHGFEINDVLNSLVNAVHELSNEITDLKRAARPR